MAYYLLLEQYIVRLQKEKVDPHKVVKILPEEVAEELESLECLSITQLFKPGSPLYNTVLNWQNLKFLILLSNIVEDNESLSKGLRNYCAKYVQHNIAHGSQVIVRDGGIVVVSHHPSKPDSPNKDIVLSTVTKETE